MARAHAVRGAGRPQGVAESSGVLAPERGTSETTVPRLCGTIGLRGYPNCGSRSPARRLPSSAAAAASEYAPSRQGSSLLLGSDPQLRVERCTR
ncbi:hypothetical protein [Microtetraspora fusca]|uniref:Uncharacterized protein n=1 Tax=Microtetraspora fusca TaxID=1997 RepID=A0ABW6UXN9_MICFU|nr:hypothetical protein [Microtetraspora fusca]